MKNFERNHMALFERSKLTFEQMNQMAENSIQMFNEFEESVTKINEESNKVEINNLMIQMLNKIELDSVIFGIETNNKTINEEIKKSKDVEHYLHENIKNLEVELNSLNVRFGDNRISFDIQLVMNDMINKIVFSENDNKQTDITENIQKHEAMLLDNITDLEKTLINYEQETANKLQIINKELEIINNERHQTELNRLKDEEIKKFSNMSEEDMQKFGSFKMQEEIINKLSSEIEMKSLMDNILNKIEFNNIYRILTTKLAKNEEKNQEVLDKLTEFNRQIFKIDKEFSETNETTKKVLKDYNDVIESKINGSLEKIKKQIYLIIYHFIVFLV